MDDRDFAPLFTWRSAVVDSALPATTRHVLLTLSLHMNERGGSCFPSVDLLSRETGLNRTTVIRQLQVARDSGWLHVQQSQGRFPNRYAAVVPPANQPSRKTTVADDDGGTERQSQTATVADDASNRRFDEPEPSFSVRPTVAQDDPSSSVVLHESSSGTLHTAAPVADAPARKRDAVFDALCHVCGIDTDELTTKTARPIGVAAADIRKAWKGDPLRLPEEIQTRAGRYVLMYAHAALTPNALASNWAKLTEKAQTIANPHARKDFARQAQGNKVDQRVARLRGGR